MCGGEYVLASGQQYAGASAQVIAVLQVDGEDGRVVGVCRNHMGLLLCIRWSGATVSAVQHHVFQRGWVQNSQLLSLFFDESCFNQLAECA